MNEKHRVLFLCTGNYYRSRFAEILFNTLAIKSGIHWHAISRGLATEVLSRNDGPISPLALMGLKERAIYIRDEARFPLQLTEQDLLEADQIIALDEREHRPLLERRFPGWENQVEYWHIPDINRLPADEALHTIEAKIHELIVQFS